MKNKSKTIILVLSIIIGVVFSATGATISAVLSKNVVCVIINAVTAGSLGVLAFFYFKYCFNIFGYFYPGSKIPAFRLVKTVHVYIAILLYLVAVGGYVGFLVPMSLFTRTELMAYLSPVISLLIAILLCVIALLVVAIISYDYNKAILLEKIEENTRKE